MALRGKRHYKLEDSLSVKKMKKRHFSDSDDEDKGPWTLKAYGNIPTHSIYNTTSRSQPAELFRKDLISAMKLPDSEPLASDEYWLLSDQWKQEWEKGVQVPVNPDEIPEGVVRVVRKKDKSKNFKLPAKLVRTTHDDFFSNDIHQMSNVLTQAEKMCRYDLDDCDVEWLKLINAERVALGLRSIDETLMESVIDEIEQQCHDNMKVAIQNQAGLGIEYDEDVICDVCRSPDTEDGNEMVFCDSCDICVHQACYGITKIPEGSWMCKTCAMGIKPVCQLCPNKGGAMKTTNCSQKWAHVSCALWIPETGIGCVDKMEPIVKISQIPASRWALVCCLCRERSGACIQCSVKTCKTAYHVTCAFKNALQMKAIIEDKKGDELKLRSYCPKHSKSREKKDGETSDSESESEERKKKVKRKKKEPRPKHEMNSEEKQNGRDEKIRQIQENFQDYVKVKEIVDSLNVDEDVVDFILNYWKLKRTAAFGKPLIPARWDDSDVLGREEQDNLYAKMRMFVHLRQDLERVRNLCYMVNRREKLNNKWFRLREEIFHKQVAALNTTQAISEKEHYKIVHMPHGNSIYDKLYSWDLSCCKEGATTNPSKSRTPNGLVVKKSVEKPPNPYAKTYINGRHRRGINEPAAVEEKVPAQKEEEVVVETKEQESENSDIDMRNKSKCRKIVVYDESPDDLEQDLKGTKTTNKSSKLGKSGLKEQGEAEVTMSTRRNERRKGVKKSSLCSEELKKDELSPLREKARQESNKVRQTLFSNTPLKGYKIPRVSTKSSTPEDDSVGSSKCNGRVTPPHTPLDETDLNRSPRLIMKLRKDPNYPQSPIWKRDEDYDATCVPATNCEDGKRPIRLKLSTNKSPEHTAVNSNMKRQRHKKEDVHSTFGMKLRTTVETS